jgi:hypothetical protein
LLLTPSKAVIKLYGLDGRDAPFILGRLSAQPKVNSPFQALAIPLLRRAKQNVGVAYRAAKNIE